MSNFIKMFKESAKELNSVTNLCVCAMLMALVLTISAFTIQIGDYIKIGFSFLASELVYMLFGPIVGMIFGGAADVFAFLIKPTGAYFFGFTLSGIVSGLIYGIFFYKKTMSITRIFIAKTVTMIVVNLLMGTYWLTLLYGKGFFVLLPMRVIKSVVMLPINTLLFYTVVRVLKQTKVSSRFLVKQ